MESINCIFFRIQECFAHRPAVIDDFCSLDYQQLHAAAKNLGIRISQYSPQDNICIGITGHPGIKTVVALLAIVLTGNHYIYVDAEQPKEWLEQQLKRVNCKFILVCAEGAVGNISNEFPLFPVSVDLNPTNLPLSDIPATQIAYINFSSGTTGEPKAIACTHAGIVRLCRNQNFLDFSAHPRFLFHSPLSFDAATLEIWGALLNGGCCVVNQEKILTPSILQQAIHGHRVDTLWLTSALFNVLVDTDIRCFNGLRTVLTGGDALSVSHVRKAFHHHPEIRFINGYGPTENTTFTCCHTITAKDLRGHDIPIGRAINGTQVLLCDPQGVPFTQSNTLGEIYALGDGLASGYLDDPERTAEVFVTLEWCGKQCQAYRTGDLAQYDDEGNLHFIGRLDQQVKINGYRIHLSGIEAKLREIPGISDCVLLVLPHQGGKRLVGILQAEDDGAARQAVRRFPSWERPSAWLCVSALPLTSHGKVNRNALLTLWEGHQNQRPASSLNPQESACAQWWSHLLGFPVTSPDSHFFASGGNSLLALRLLAACQSDYPDAPLALNDLHQNATLREFTLLLVELGIDPACIGVRIPDEVLVL
ncbi:AMP-binding protein [Salmonella enterica]|nr:AMP-binding protein [Salmonella enterica]EDB9445772.1 AMP-binding protein [Salmonella enterica subsp. enterica serovar Enteritidis]EBI5032914.1 AMP-binding protein [Salmonella enterica]EBN2823450.1 AMP-binding protein [Salmonella enterica]ECU1628797.1 AMP-binding protein [Salmonella enterica]